MIVQPRLLIKFSVVKNDIMPTPITIIMVSVYICIVFVMYMDMV